MADMDHLQRFAADYLSRHAGALEEAHGGLITASLIAEQDARNAVRFNQILMRLHERTKQLAKDREDYCRKLLEHRLPRPLHWLINHPRLLKRVLRVVKRWEPCLVFVHLDSTMTAESAVEMSERWMAEMRAKGRWRPPSKAAFVFTYTDASGLPAEVCGP